MARKRRFSDEPFGPTVERLMDEAGVTYRRLAEKTGLSAGYLNHLVHGNRPVPSNDVDRPLADALGVEAEHFREYRMRVITERLEQHAGDCGSPTSSYEVASVPSPATVPISDTVVRTGRGAAWLAR